jgi:NAD(P)H:quinone oxidoreductase type IV
VAAGLAIFMAQLDTTIVNVALPTMRSDLGLSAGAVEWMVLGYLIPLMALSLLFGRWIDRSGGRAVATVATTGFGMASVAAAALPGAAGVISARVIQGAFASALLAAAPVLAIGAVRIEARGRALGVVSTLAPLGALAGPALGGALVDAFGWRSIFLVNVPVAAVVVSLVRRSEDARPLTGIHGAWLGEAALLASAAALALMSLSFAADNGLPWLLGVLLAGAPLLWWSRTQASRPVRDLLRRPGVRAPHVALLTSYTSLLGVQFLIPFFMQNQMQSTTAVVGFTVLAYPAAAAAAGPVSGSLSDRRGRRAVAVCGATVLALGVTLLAPLSSGWSPVDVGWRLALIGLGFGLFVTPIQAVVLEAAGADRVGLASATTNVARQAGLALGPAIGTLAWGLDQYQTGGMRAGVVTAAALGFAAVAAATCASERRSRGKQETPLDELTNRPATVTSLHHREESNIMSLKVAVIYYSATGNVHALARGVAEGAEKEGAEVRLLRVPELAPDSAIDANPAWRRHVEETKDVPVATLADLEWADAYAFGSPTRYGNIASQLKQFIDTTGPLWAQGKLSNKAATAFTSAINMHGGNETTLMALYNTMCHWGTIIVPPGYTDGTIPPAGGNPYGTAHASATGAPTQEALAAAVYQGRRLVRFGSAVVEVQQVA